MHVPLYRRCFGKEVIEYVLYITISLVLLDIVETRKVHIYLLFQHLINYEHGYLTILK